MYGCDGGGCCDVCVGNGCRHIGITTDVDEVMTNYTTALSLCGVCPGQLQSFLGLPVILKKQN